MAKPSAQKFINRNRPPRVHIEYDVEIGDAQKQLDDAHKEADQANQKITSLEDELHRAGGPPGWAR